MPEANIATRLTKIAKIHPYRKAVICPTGRDKAGRVAYAHLTFEQLDEQSNRLAAGLVSKGVAKGVRTILMVKPSLEFFTIIFALFKAGAIPVVVDPGMGVRRMAACLKESDPEAFIGIPLAHVLRKILPSFFKNIKIFVTAGKRWFWGGYTIRGLMKGSCSPLKMADTGTDDMAAILFTTGSTGPAKGVIYTHGNFDAQLHQISTHLNLTGDEIDLSTFPLFALFWPALGITSVIPDMDPTRPAFVNPEKIVEAIRNQGVTNMFASPALLNRVGAYGKKKGIKVPSLKRVICAGAPVFPANIEQFSAILGEDAEIQTPYGATEAVPVLSISGSEILSETRYLSEEGYGICVGRPINNIPVHIIRISDDPILGWSNDLEIEDGKIGEIVVSGALVTSEYYKRPKDDALSKIQDGDRFWHRMGDVGWKDEKGRFWFCGRKSHRVLTDPHDAPMFTIPCEAIFNCHPAVFRSALVGIGAKGYEKPVICIELEKGTSRLKWRRGKIRRELLDLAAANPLTGKINTILFHKSFPVDIRHNSKIFREQLTVWAEKKIVGSKE